MNKNGRHSERNIIGSTCSGRSCSILKIKETLTKTCGWLLFTFFFKKKKVSFFDCSVCEKLPAKFRFLRREKMFFWGENRIILEIKSTSRYVYIYKKLSTRKKIIIIIIIIIIKKMVAHPTFVRAAVLR